MGSMKWKLIESPGYDRKPIIIWIVIVMKRKLNLKHVTWSASKIKILKSNSFILHKYYIREGITKPDKMKYYWVNLKLI